METACLRHTDVPHTSRLFADFSYHFDRVAAFYQFNHSDPASYAQAAARIDYPDDRRRSVIKALREQNGGSPQLDLLSQPGTVAVVTGQQVGLFSGPCYTIYKALTAARLASELTASGQSAVAVFWLATEDHDLADVDHCWSFDASQTPARLAIEHPNGEPRPVGDVTPASYPVDALRSSLGGFAHGNEIAALAAKAYVAGKPLGDAFRDLLKSLLEPLGLLFLDPMRPAVRALAAPLVRSALEMAPELYEELSSRNNALEAAGYHAQVLVEPKTSLVFLLENGLRLSLRRDGRQYASGSRRLLAEDLAQRAESLSPNVLLRPVVQDYLLPTVAFVAGPAELAYLAQSEVLYRSLLGRAPVFTPRCGFTLLDERSAKLLERYGLTAASCFHGLEPLRNAIAAQLVPPDLQAAFEKARVSTAASIDHLGDRLAAMDPTVAAAMERSRGKIFYQLRKIERKAERAALSRDERAARHAEFLYRLVYPEKHLQERFYTILPFLARHGPGLVERLYSHVRLECPDHIVCYAN